MDAVRYESWTRNLRKRPAAVRALRLINEGMKYLCYVLYPLLLALIYLNMPDQLLRYVLVPGALFVVLSIFRYCYDAPRPYEVLPIEPLIHKDTKGKSFPSRHVFSVFAIAMCWLSYCVPVGIALFISGIVMAVIRVLGGVHYPKDVIVGAFIAILGCFIGLWVIP